MRHAGLDQRIDQAAALGRIVVIIFERVLDRFGDHDRPGEMHHRADVLFGHDPRNQLAIFDIALVKSGARRHGEAKAGRQIVDDGHFPAAVEQREHGMAADIAGATGNKDGTTRIRMHSCLLAAIEKPAINAS